ncbi:MAG: enolase [Patescibacteria group bacterium]|nr:enolase [Patescibacteria group bacterium]
MKIDKIKAYEILDSRGNPTVAVQIQLNNGISEQAMVPSGASTGTYEAKELRDKDMKRYWGKGVLGAIKNIEEVIAPALRGYQAEKQEEIDQIMIELDGTADKSKLGANAILAVSLAVAKVAAKAKGQALYQYLTKFNPNFSGTYLLPRPMMNVLNGGQHAAWASDIQEYMIIPQRAKTIADAVRMGAEVYASLKQVLKEKNYSTLIGDEGGFAPNVKNNSEPFSLLEEATQRAGYIFGTDIVIALDAAASEFFEAGVYNLKKEGKKLTSDELAEFYQQIIKKYPLVSLEDAFFEDDFISFAKFLKTNPNLQLVGDDLYVTNRERLERGIKEKASNSILIKLNQIGTLTETIATINQAQQNGLTTIISHRSGETEDTFIADLAVAMGSGQIKTGSLARTERTAKYNRLIIIERELGTRARIADWPFKLPN